VTAFLGFTRFILLLVNTLDMRIEVRESRIITAERAIPVAALIDLSSHSKPSSWNQKRRIPLSPPSASQCGRDQEQRCVEEMPEPENGVIIIVLLK